MLTLPIKKKWFDMIANGEKTEEYRAITPRYTTMFKNAANDSCEFLVKLRNGYSLSSPSLVCRVNYRIDTGRADWGAEPNVKYYVLSILSIEN